MLSDWSPKGFDTSTIPGTSDKKPENTRIDLLKVPKTFAVIVVRVDLQRLC